MQEAFSRLINLITAINGNSVFKEVFVYDR